MWAGEQEGLRGVVRITTRGMWIDEGRLLVEIQKAAEQALANVRRNSTIVYIERAVSNEIRKVRVPARTGGGEFGRGTPQRLVVCVGQN